MKKNFFIIIGVFIIIIVVLFFMYNNLRKNELLAQKQNREYEKYTTEEILGSTLMTIINKAIDENERNEILKDSKDRYIENDENSIKIQIMFLESDKTYDMEAIANSGAEQFVKNFYNIKFKCTKIEYHEKTKKLKYMLFSEV